MCELSHYNLESKSILHQLSLLLTFSIDEEKYEYFQGVRVDPETGIKVNKDLSYFHRTTLENLKEMTKELNKIMEYRSENKEEMIFK